MEKKRKPFANTANVQGIAISETSKLFLKCEAMMNDVFECIQNMEENDETKKYDFVRCVCNALGKIAEAISAIEDLHSDYSHEIQLKTNYEFI